MKFRAVERWQYFATKRQPHGGVIDCSSADMAQRNRSYGGHAH